jgi:hypothetical protein
MRGRPVTLTDFSGGLNTKADVYTLEENEASQALNLRPTVRGSIKSRFGDERIHAAAALGASVTALGRMGEEATGGAEQLLIGLGDGSLHRSDGPTLTSLVPPAAADRWEFADGPSPSGGSTTAVTFAVDGAGNANRITVAGGAVAWAATSGTLPAQARFLLYAGNRMWAAGMSSYGSLVDPASALVFSDLGDPNAWPAANVVVFDPFDGEEITGIGEVGAGILVFKGSKAWLVYDLDTGANRPLGVGVGCVSHRSIQQTPQGTVFLGDGAVWITDGTTTRKLSDNIEPDLLAATLANATSAVDDQRYLLGIPSTVVLEGNIGATTTMIYEYDFETRSWWQHTTAGTVLANAQLTGSTRPRVFAGGSAGVDRMFTRNGYLNAAGAALARTWLGPYHALGAGRERLRGIEVEGLGMFGIGLVTDYASGLSLPTVARDEADLGSGLSRRTESDFGVAAGFQVGFYANGLQPPAFTVPIPGYTAADMRIDAYTLYLTRRPG